MSFDTPESNNAFKQNESFQFPLWSDVDRELAIHYGAASGSKDLFAARLTVLIDPQGIWRLVYPLPGSVLGGLYAHAQEVLDDMTLILNP